MPVLATSLVLALFAAAAILTSIAYALPSARVAIGSIAGAATLILGFYHTGGFGAPNPGIFPRSSALGPDSRREEGCARAIQLLEENRVVIDRSEADRIVVSKALWEQIPPPTQQIMIQCFSADSQHGVEIVQR